MEHKDSNFFHGSSSADFELSDSLIKDADIPSRSKRLLDSTDYHFIDHDLDTLPKGLHSFHDYSEVYWTDAALDSATSSGKTQIATKLGVELDQIISFSAANHTNEVIVVDDQAGLHKIDVATNPVTGQEFEAGWSEPIRPPEHDKSIGAERGTYDGIILVGKEKFQNNYLLATGADCTSVGVRGKLKNGEEFIAIAHSGRKGTMTGVMDNLAKRLQWLGVVTNSIEIFVGPAAQAIEVPVDVLEKEGADNNSWRKESISNEYVKEGTRKVLYNNQLDSVRRLAENLGVNGEQVHIIDVDTVSEKSQGKLHSFRRDKTAERNSLLIGFEKN